MKRLLLLAATGIISMAGQAQKMNAKAGDIADMFKRQLIVEFADTVEDVRDRLTAYPQKTLGYLIKAAVEEYWKVNTKIEYQNQYDIKRNLDRGEARNVYLFLTKHPDSKPEKTVWILNYSRGNMYHEGKTDYQIYLPDISRRSVKEFTRFDIEFTISVMQEHLKHMQKSGKEITPMEYFYVEAAKNCKSMKSSPQHVLIDQAYLSKSVDEKKLRRAFRRTNHSLLTAEQINNVIADKQDTCAVILLYPGKFESLSTSAMGEKYIFWNKVLVNGSTYKVMGAVGNGRKDNVLIEIEQDDLEALLECD